MVDPQLTAKTTLGHTNVVSMGMGGYKGGEYRGVWGEKRGDHSRGVGSHGLTGMIRWSIVRASGAM